MLRLSALTMHRRRSLRVATLSVLALATGASLSPAHAQSSKSGRIPETAIREYAVIKQFFRALPAAEKKLSTQLVFAHRTARNLALPAPVAASARARKSSGTPLVETDKNGRIRVDIAARTTASVVNAITTAGGTVLSASRQAASATTFPITAFVPPQNLLTLAQRPDVLRIRASRSPVSEGMKGYAPLRRSRLALGPESLIVHGINTVQNQYGVTGSGVNIGVISDGVMGLEADNVTTALTKAITTGVLPGNITIVSANTTDPAPGGNTVDREGVPMLEILYNIAPDANLFFAKRGDTAQECADNIRALRDKGCTIILDDGRFVDEPAFQDGVIAQAINDVTSTGVVFFSAAGNTGNLANGTSQVWEGDYKDSGQSLVLADNPDINYGQIHQFGTQLFNQVTKTNADQIYLQWSDPWGGTSANGNIGSSNDYDLIVVDKDGHIAGGGTDLAVNTQAGDPADLPLEGPVNAAPTDSIYVVNTNGAEARCLRLSIFAATPLARKDVADPYVTPSFALVTNGGIGHHAGAASVVAVGASPAVNTVPTLYGATAPGPGNALFQKANVAEPFSADGPRLQFYTSDGVAITPGNVLKATSGGKSLQKPEVVGADGVTTSQPAPPTTFLNPFYGTSAAVPHIAGIGALVKQAFPNLTAAGIKALFTRSSAESATEYTSQDLQTTGVDDTSGYGAVIAPKVFTSAASYMRANTFKIMNITDTSAQVYWETNFPGDSFVDTSAGTFGSATLVTTTVGTYRFAHTVTLTGLTPNKRYFIYQARSANADFGMSGSTTSTGFSTKPSTTTTLPANLFISGATAIRSGPGNRVMVTVSVKNAGATVATNVPLTVATMGGQKTITTLPVKIPVVTTKGTATVLLVFNDMTAGTYTLSITLDGATKTVRVAVP